jgi:NAD+ diphosphatase
MSTSPLLQDLALARSTVDRSAHQRKDVTAMARAWSDTSSRVIPVFRGSSPVNEARGLKYFSPSDIADITPVAFLGSESGQAFFAAFVDQDFVEQHDPESWRHLRVIGSSLSAQDAGLLVTGVALANWHETHTHCSRCGEHTSMTDAGWTRTCPVDKSVHFPRTDPAVIMLITDHHDRALLARQVRWQPGWLSVLAGFVEAGESAEAAVVREIAEEAGVRINPSSIHYLGSQPWPFPNSLMLGYHARVSETYVPSDPIELIVDGEEIAHAQWFSREELLEASRSGEIHLPPPVSIAHRLIVQWLGEPLPRESAFR